MSIQYIKGDATNPIGEGKKIIIHICNDVGKWGRGFVLSLSKKWKTPEKEYKLKQEYKLGEIQISNVENDISVVNMIAQHGIRFTYIPPIRYDALKKCLNQVAELALKNNASIHTPRIGCGLAGGNWKDIEEIIKEELLDKNINVIVYDL